MTPPVGSIATSPDRATIAAWLSLEGHELDALCAEAAASARAVHGDTISIARNVFIPAITHCRDDCSYCTFKQDLPYAKVMTPEESVAVAEAGRIRGCTEALIVTGDRPETKYQEVRDIFSHYGVTSTPEYLYLVAKAIRDATGLLPHINCGVLDPDELMMLREVTGSMGLMLENISDRLCDVGEVHRRSPDKRPARRMAMLKAGAEAKTPLTTGFLIGIGETKEEIAETILALAELAEGGQIQELIVQNFRAKPETPMAGCKEPAAVDMRRVLAATRLALGPDMPIQAPPNLTPEEYGTYLSCGITDWGGVSPVTIDHVNPEAPWPQLETLRRVTEAAGFQLRDRLTLYPRYIRERRDFIHPDMAPHVDALADGDGFAKPVVP